MTNITVNYKKNTIEITKSFEKKASVYGSEAYYELSKARNDFPNYRLIVKTSKSNNTFKGMDYEFMLDYINNHEDSEKHKAEFDKLKENNLSYGEVKQWFVSTYPVFENCKTRAQWVLAA
ncbi:MAG: hypothetical protein J6D42_11895 [Clostridia bacterium]|nr:hypothetical protein [Clostridia bacterium]